MSVLTLQSVDAAPWGDPVLTDINLQLEPGEVIGLIGPNGAGKSSLLRLLAGDFAASSGRLHFAGRALDSWPRQQLAQRRAFLPQLSLLNFPYTVEEVVLLGRTPHSTGLRADQDIVRQVLRATDTLSLRNRLYTQLSGGERQRVQLARVLAQLWHNTDMNGTLLLLDEPTAALGVHETKMVADLIKELKSQGLGIFLISHDTREMMELCDRVAVMKNGKLIGICLLYTSPSPRD